MLPSKNPTAVTNAAAKTNGQVKDVPFVGHKFRSGYKGCERVHTFDRTPARNPRQSFSFSGRGFLPDFFNMRGLVTLHEASATNLENEGVHGREGMLPPGGVLNKIQATDSGSGGAGSFNTVSAFGARTNG